MLSSLNSVTSFLIFIFLSWAIMSDRVRDGIVVKIGMVFMSIGFFGAFAMDRANHQTLEISQAIENFGLLICIVGFVWRFKKMRCRRLSDWIT